MAMPALSQNFDKTGGLPFIRNYTPEEYNAHEKSFEMVQDLNGIMYFANFSGILEYDGTKWTKIPSSSGMRILSMNMNAKGQVFAGGLYDFGYLEKDKKGLTHFFSLVDSTEDKTTIGLIYKVLCIDNYTYFFSDKTMFCYDGTKTEKITLDNQALSAFRVNKQIFILFDSKNNRSNASGLCIYHDKKFKKVVLKTEMPFLNILFMIPTGNKNEIMIGSENQGIFLLKNNEIIVFESPINEYIKKYGLSCGIKSSKSNYAIGTLTGGIVLINESGKILKVIDRSSKLQDESINSLFLDKGASLWITTNNGISKAEINWPLSYIDNKTSGLFGKVQDIEELANSLYFATDQGLFYLEASSINKINKIEGACLSLLKINDYILAATSRGIFKVKGLNVQAIENTGFTFCMAPSSVHTNLIYVGQNRKVVVYQKDNNNIKAIQTIPGMTGDVLNLVEDKEGDLYMEVSPGKIYIYKSKNKQLVEIEAEINFTYLHLNKKAGEIFLSSEKGLYSINKASNKIIPFSLLPNDTASQQLWIHDLFEISENSYVVTNGEQKNLSFLNTGDNRVALNPTQFLPVASFSVQTTWLNDKKSQLWAGGKDGLLISNYKDLYDYDANFKTQISKIRIISKDSLINLNEKTTRIGYSNNSLQFEFSAPVFPAMGKVEYRFFLKGFDKDTSSWDLLTKKDYTNLPDGEYRFMVEARNEFGKIADKAEFSFKVLTPIFRQWWAILIYVLILIVLIRFYFIWSMRASEKEKDRLEEIVKERTEEIERSKTKIEEQRDIAYKQKKEILDSISYAQRIQQAVLPSTQYADDILLEHFIYYKPRDIVSGDFYWMKKINNYVAVVAADCTGHGVPGAFMSMLGSSFLNEIITRRSMDSAAQILNRLRSKVKQSLHQEGKEGEQKDGMDIALLIIDSETLMLQYAGAYNPLYIIRPNQEINLKDESIDIDARYELIHLKADRQPIGIHLAEKEFTNHVFQLKNGDSLYSFSDGYVDQFGGETGEKFKSKRFKELLMSAQGKSMIEQKIILEQAFMKWKRDLAQIDDVLVMGIKV